MIRVIPFILLLVGCSTTPDPQTIIDQAIEAAGSNLLFNAQIEFEFRDREYGLKRNGGNYEMVRLWEDESLGVVRDVVSNNDFIREVNGEPVQVADSMAMKYSNSINSVFYFALLPFRLNDDAVVKKYLGAENIEGKLYDKIEITFQQENGGKDHEDVFIYWIDQQSKFIDFLAYSYLTEGGGMRFRKAYNARVVNGVRLVDYINYEPTKEVNLVDIGRAYTNGNLKELSRIELKKAAVILHGEL